MRDVPFLASPVGWWSGKAGGTGELLGRGLVLLPLVAATFLSKISAPPLGERGLSLILPLTTLALTIGLLSGRMRFAPARLTAFLLAYTCLMLLQLVHADRFSPGSVAIMGFLGLAYTLESNTVDSLTARRAFGIVAVVIAALGVAQFLIQFLLSTAATFPIETFVPPEWRTQRYNNVIPLHWGATVYKANGVVMLEPSDFSQLCAIGIINELANELTNELRKKARLIRLAVLGAGLLTSYSGTGLVVLAVALPAFVMLQRRWSVILYGMLAVSLLMIFAEPLHLDVISSRAHEFESSDSSGYARFVAWRHLFAARVWTDPVATWLGHGAGAFAAASVEYGAAEMVFSKILFEFGLLGGVTYFAFILWCLMRAPVPLAVRIAVAVAYFMNGAYSPWFTGLALGLLLWPSSSPSSVPIVGPIHILSYSSARQGQMPVRMQVGTS
jgi:hypothetical protein